uniref:Uncharacterized protein n=1 Tax=Meloidogyne enterolobii TaxID=390850 RepID=A0A6V7X982_MELEN|nr:unnamed protein product [Meloidogyne enterolobii]
MMRKLMVTACPLSLLLSTLFMATCRTEVASLSKPEIKIRIFNSSIDKAISARSH